MIWKSKKFLALGLSLAALVSSVGSFSAFASDDEEVKSIGDESTRGSTLFSSLCSQRAFERIEEVTFKFLTDSDSKSGSTRTVISLDRLKELLLKYGKIEASKLDFTIPDKSLNQNDFGEIILLLVTSGHRLVEEDAYKLLRKFSPVRKKIPKQKKVRGYYEIGSEWIHYHHTVPAIGEKSECINDVLFSYLIGLNLRTGEKICSMKEISLEDFFKKYLIEYTPAYSYSDIKVSDFKYGYNTFFKLSMDGFRLSMNDAAKLLCAFWNNNADHRLKPDISLHEFECYIMEA